MGLARYAGWSLFLASVLSAVGYRVALNLGVFVDTRPLNVDKCALVDRARSGGAFVRLPGVEDVVVSSSGFAFLSSDDRRQWLSEDLLFDPIQLISRPGVSDGVFAALDLRQPNLDAYVLPRLLGDGVPASELETFHPHGIGLLELGEAEWELYAVVHTRLGDSVQIYEVVFDAAENSRRPTALKLRDVIRSPETFTGLNDIVPVNPRLIEGSSDPAFAGSRGFFVSNLAHGPVGTLMNFLEMLFARPWSSVAYCTRGSQTPWTCAPALKDIVTPNGVALSQAQARLYVASTTGRVLSAYPLALAHGPGGITPGFTGPPVVVPLAPPGDDVASLGDNIDVDPATGDLYLGVHPATIRFLAHSGNASLPAPSAVFRASFPGGDLAGIRPSAVRVETVLADDGNTIAASSVGAYHQSNNGEHVLVVGTVFRDGVFVCRFKDGEAGFGRRAKAGGAT